MRIVFTSPELGKVNMDLKDRLWCGPAAVSCITGQPVSIVHSLIKKYRIRQGYPKNGRWITHIDGTYKEDLHYVFKKFAHTLRPYREFILDYDVDLRKCDAPTLGSWLKNRSPRELEKTFLVHITGHWCLVKGDFYFDNHLARPIRISKIKGKKTRVHHVYEVLKKKKISY